MDKNDFKNIIIERLPDSDCEVIEYTASRQPCKILCNKCKREFSRSRADSFLQRARDGFTDVCKWCETNSDRANKHNNLVNKLQTLNPNIECLNTQFKNSKESIQFHCKQCDTIFTKTPAAYLNVPKCPFCEQERIYKLDIDVIKKRTQSIWSDEYTVLSNEYNGKRHSSNRILVKHNVCGFCWSVNVFNFLQKGKGCPKCAASKPEKEIRKWLENNNFSFEEQKVINYKNHNFRFDFCITINGQIKMLEYHGNQHFIPVSIWGGEEGLKKQQLYDSLKEEYCKKNNIELIILKDGITPLLNDELAQRLRGQAIE